MSDRVIAGRYRLLEELGSSGMGTVWRAYDERLRRTVAVKQVHLPGGLSGSQSDELIRRTMREGRIAARLHHPQLITMYDVVQDGGQPYLIMEHFPSTSLAKLGVLPYAEVARIGAEAAEALAAAHETGVVHRDVKPANILVGADGMVKITDFGISRAVEDLTGTLTGTLPGTPDYLAPEVAKGEQATFASDVYALGATLYTAVEGKPPVGTDANPIRLLYRVASGEITPPTKAGPLGEVLMWLLSADPAARPTMNGASAALAAVRANAPATADAWTVANTVITASPAGPAEAQPTTSTATAAAEHADVAAPTTAPANAAASATDQASAATATTPAADAPALAAGEASEAKPATAAAILAAEASSADTAAPATGLATNAAATPTTEAAPVGTATTGEASAATPPDTATPTNGTNPTDAALNPTTDPANGANPANVTPTEAAAGPVGVATPDDTAAPASTPTNGISPTNTATSTADPANKATPGAAATTGEANAATPVDAATPTDTAAGPATPTTDPTDTATPADASATGPGSAATPASTASPAASSANPASGATPASEAKAAIGANAAPGPTTTPQRRRLRAMMLAAGLLAVALTAALITFLVDAGNPGHKAADDKAAPPAKTTSHTTTPKTEQTTTTEPTTTTTTTTTTQAPQPPPQQQQPQTPATPDAAISDYYAIVLTNRDLAWTRLTPTFQAHPAGGRSGYDRWWNTIASVTASDVAQLGPNTVEATILYTFTSGERRRERHRYTLVDQNGVWLIDTVAVLSSSTPA